MKDRHRSRKRKTPARQVICLTAVCLAAALVLVFLVWEEQKRQQELQITADGSYNSGSGYRDVLYQGKHYRYNSLVTAILYAGIDSTGRMEPGLQYGSSARADMIALLILNKKNGTMTALSVSRDTMTEVRRYTLNGNDNGLAVTHLGYAYSYGEGGRVSCENLREAVSGLLGGIPIREYIVTNQDSIPYLNELAGGITVTVPNNELQDQYPELEQGKTVTLDDSNVRAFLQYRDTGEFFSNEGRMERQKAYVTAYIEKLQQMSSSEMTDVWESLEETEGFLQTSITRNKYLDLADLLQQVAFSEESFLTIPGENRTGELHDEFYPDREALRQLVIDLFYEEV